MSLLEEYLNKQCRRITGHSQHTSTKEQLAKIFNETAKENATRYARSKK